MSLCACMSSSCLLGRFLGAALLRQVVGFYFVFFRNYQTAFENGCPFTFPPVVLKTPVPPQCASPVCVCECWCVCHVTWWKSEDSLTCQSSPSTSFLTSSLVALCSACQASWPTLWAFFLCLQSRCRIPQI